MMYTGNGFTKAFFLEESSCRNTDVFNQNTFSNFLLHWFAPACFLLVCPSVTPTQIWWIRRRARMIEFPWQRWLPWWCQWPSCCGRGGAPGRGGWAGRRAWEWPKFPGWRSEWGLCKAKTVGTAALAVCHRLQTNFFGVLTLSNTIILNC